MLKWYNFGKKTVNYIKHKLQDVMVKSNIKITILEPIEVYNMESNRQMAIYNGSNSLSDYRLVIQYKKKKIIIALDIKW